MILPIYFFFLIIIFKNILILKSQNGLAWKDLKAHPVTTLYYGQGYHLADEAARVHPTQPPTFPWPGHHRTNGH